MENQNEAVIAVRPARMLDRLWVRERFEERFSVEQMAASYYTLYGKVMERAEPAVSLVMA